VANNYVFGYGSLAAHPAGLVRAGASDEGRVAEGFTAELLGHQRWWGVAMDNRQTVGGYKAYLDDRGLRPAIDVAFLDLRPSHEATLGVNGLCAPATAAELAALDARERNYRRVDVSGSLSIRAGSDRVWAYVGLETARERAQRARARGTLVVHRAYRELVESGFAALGPAALAQYHETTAGPDCPERALTRIDLPVQDS